MCRGKWPIMSCVTKTAVFTFQRQGQHREVSVYGRPGKTHDVGETGTATGEEHVTTCTACRVTIHHHQQPGPWLRAACPFCGQPYIATPTGVPQTEQPPVGVGVGAGRVHGQRSCSDPVLPSFRLPAIVSTCSWQSPSDTCPNKYRRGGSATCTAAGVARHCFILQHTIKRYCHKLSIPETCLK
jgi:hypothetical protein